MKNNGGLIKVLSMDFGIEGIPDHFSEPIPRGNNLKAHDLCLFLTPSLDTAYLTLLRKVRRISTHHDLAKAQDVVELRGLDLDRATKLMKPYQRKRIGQAIAGKKIRIPPTTWLLLMAGLKRENPDMVAAIDRLFERHRLGQVQLQGGSWETVAGEKDAANLALRLSGFPSRLILDRPTADTSRPAPFLADLSATTLREDAMIANDMKVFGDWTLIRDYAVGASVFNYQGNTLTILNTNRTPIEETLGVDLIYYNQPADSFLCIQYKRMTDESGSSSKAEAEPQAGDEPFNDPDEELESGRYDRFVYRPHGDRNFAAECNRIEEFLARTKTAAIAGTLAQYRLNYAPFYFKLCPRARLNPLSTTMISGMYLPFDYLKLLLGAEETVGKRGGQCVLSHSTVRRYLTNTSIVQLFQDGWIGSSGIHSAAISEIIRRCLEDGHSVTLASLKSTPEEPTETPVDETVAELAKDQLERIF